MSLPRIYPVGELAAYLRELLANDQELHDCWVAGEVSNVSQSGHGHYYFTIKDEDSQMRCVLFRNDAMWQTVLPENGAAIVAHGYVSVYEATGNLQFYVDMLQAEGKGALFMAFERLKAMMDAEGLFAEDRKRPLPEMPRRIGIVTSPQAAALQDILNVLGRRYPLAEVVLAPTQVQGDTAPRQIAAAITALNLLEGDEAVDVIIVARGGGSLEELWAFNEEVVARTVFASRTPVVSGVGHETDTTIIDYVADLRAPTPSAAAELATPDAEELRFAVESMRRELVAEMSGQLAVMQDMVESERQRLERLSPSRQAAADRQHLADMVALMSVRLRHRLALDRERVNGSRARLDALSPLQILKRGYAIVRDLDSNTVVSGISGTRPGHLLEVRVSDGAFGARVERSVKEKTDGRE